MSQYIIIPAAFTGGETECENACSAAAYADERAKHMPAQHIIFMLGAVDVGKTHMTTKLANAFFMRGFRVAVVDADIGQSDIGPPCCVGVGILRRSVRFLHEVPLCCIFFVGSTSPMNCIRESICGTVSGVKKAKELGADVIIVDSTGWVSGKHAVEFKIKEIMHTKPSFIVAIERENELQPLIDSLLNHFPHRLCSSSSNAEDVVDVVLSASFSAASPAVSLSPSLLPSSSPSSSLSDSSLPQRHDIDIDIDAGERAGHILRLKASENVRRKARWYRRRLREIAFNRYFRDARNRLFPISSFERTPSEADEGVICGFFAAPSGAVKEASEVGADHATDSAVGAAAYCEKEAMGIGVLRRIDRRSGVAVVLTPVREDEVVIRLGRTRLWRVKGRLREFKLACSG